MSGQSYKGFPIAQPLLPKDGSFDDFSRPPYYRMTAAGWNAFDTMRLQESPSQFPFSL
jgi:hypothetical protein